MTYVVLGITVHVLFDLYMLPVGLIVGSVLWKLFVLSRPVSMNNIYLQRHLKLNVHHGFFTPCFAIFSLLYGFEPIIAAMLVVSPFFFKDIQHFYLEMYERIRYY